MNKMTTESVEVKTRTTLVQQGQQEVILSETEHINSEKGSQIDSYYDANLHNLLKNDVSEMYRMWDDTNDRIRCRLENLEASLIIWKQFENGLSQFQTTLDKDRGALSGLRGALETGESTDQNELISNIQQVAKLLSERIDNSIQVSINISIFFFLGLISCAFVGQQRFRYKKKMVIRSFHLLSLITITMTFPFQ
jgi:hypothetical protein